MISESLDFAMIKLSEIKQNYINNYDDIDIKLSIYFHGRFMDICKLCCYWSNGWTIRYIRFCSGRQDSKSITNNLCNHINNHDKLLPSPEMDIKSIRDIFNRMGFDDQEIVVLIGGGHVLGRCHIENSGYNGTWVDNPIQFNELLKLYVWYVHSQ